MAFDRTTCPKGPTPAIHAFPSQCAAANRAAGQLGYSANHRHCCGAVTARPIVSKLPIGVAAPTPYRAVQSQCAPEIRPGRNRGCIVQRCQRRREGRTRHHRPIRIRIVSYQAITYATTITKSALTPPLNVACLHCRAIEHQIRADGGHTSKKVSVSVRRRWGYVGS